jgi:hypothetical protein
MSNQRLTVPAQSSRRVASRVSGAGSRNVCRVRWRENCFAVFMPTVPADFLRGRPGTADGAEVNRGRVSDTAWGVGAEVATQLP